MSRDRNYAFVGNGTSGVKAGGISIYSYDPDNALMELLETKFPDIKIRMQYLDRERRILYATGDRAGDHREGGLVMAVRIHPDTGEAELINEKKTLLPRPSYLWVDPSRQYLLVAHLLSDHFISYLVQNESGSYQSRVRCDDGGIVVFGLERDGSLGSICDVCTMPKEQQELSAGGISHQHCIQADPQGRLYVVCDEGLDRLFTYRFNYGKGGLELLGVYQFQEGTAPRCCVFHPTLPMLYCISRYCAQVHVFRCDMENGQLVWMESVSLVMPEKTGGQTEMQARDILFHPSGRYVYVSSGTTDLLSVFEVDGDGMLCLRQNIFADGAEPFGMCISPDRRFLMVTEMVSKEVNSFSILSDGTLIPTGKRVGASCPTNIRIL